MYLIMVYGKFVWCGLCVSVCMFSVCMFTVSNALLMPNATGLDRICMVEFNG